MDLGALKVFLAVAQERSFSRAAAKVHRTQPAVSQAVRRLELELGEQLFDRSSKTGTLTEAGKMLQNYGQRLVRLAEETESAVRELRDLRRGRVLIGANEAAVHTLLPLIGRFRERYPDIAIDVRRVPARQIAVEVQQGSLDFGALTFHPAEEGLLEVPVGTDELVLLVPPSHELASRRQVAMADIAHEPVVAHNDPSPARERVLRLFEEHRVPLHMVISLPSLDGIKRAVELKLGVALLPRRCALTEIASGRLVAVLVAGVSRKRQVMLVCRKAHRSHAADAFLAVAQDKSHVQAESNADQTQRTPRTPR
jgi:DNA-binding transcriptional LysR family regulator